MHSLCFHKGILAPGDCYYYYTLLLYTGTDEKAIILVLTRRSNEQRQEIRVKFKVKYGKVQIEQWFQSRDNNYNNNNIKAKGLRPHFQNWFGRIPCLA